MIEKLLESPSLSHEIYCVFISSTSRQTPLFCQRAAQSQEGFVCWDYHVIVVAVAVKDNACSYVLDLDTTLQPFPCPASLYCSRTLRPEMQLKSEYHRLFRIVPASVYFDCFSSDRTHMKDSNVVPPPWPCIVGKKAMNENVIDWYRYIKLQEAVAPPTHKPSVWLDTASRQGQYGMVLEEFHFLRWITERGGSTAVQLEGNDN